MNRRTRWYAPDLSIVDEPLLKSLWKYRFRQDRWEVPDSSTGNLVSSRMGDGRHMPIIDLDVPHIIVESSTEGHSHVYLNVPMSRARWLALMIGLRLSRVVEPGFFIWSLRRGGNFVRIPGVGKTEANEYTKPTYGWIFKLRKRQWRD